MDAWWCGQGLRAAGELRLPLNAAKIGNLLLCLRGPEILIQPADGPEKAQHTLLGCSGPPPLT